MNYRAILLVAAGLVALSSCTKEDPAPANSQPYYQFAAADQAWLLTGPDNEWVFQNAQGQQRRYRLQETSTKKYSYTTGHFGLLGTTTHYYYDYREVVFARVDSLEHLEISMERNLPAGVDKANPPQEGSVLSVRVKGDDFLGSAPNDLFTSGFLFQADQVRPETQQVNGQQYSAVVRLESGGTVCSVCARPRRISRVLYDRQYGIVRMESVTGEIWERVR